MESETKFGFNIERKPSDITLSPVDEHRFTLIWLHGLGDVADSFVDFFYSPNPWLPNKNTKVILLQAPKQPVSINDGQLVPSWYDISYIPGSSKTQDNEMQIAKTNKRIQQVI